MVKPLVCERNVLAGLDLNTTPLWIQLTEDIYGSHQAHNLKEGNLYRVEEIKPDYMGYGIFYFRAQGTQVLCSVRPGGCRWTFDKRTAELWRAAYKPRKRIDLDA